MMCNFRNGIIRWQISKYLKSFRAFFLASFREESLTFKKLVKITKCNFRICTIQVAYVKIYKTSPTKFHFVTFKK